MNLYVGTSGYSYKAWKGAFYPEDLPDKQMLHFYARQFSAVEINNTFYRTPRESVLENWAREVPGEFKFALKAPQRITHLQRLKDSASSLSYLLQVAGALQERLGPILFQLPPGFKKDVGRLGEFLGLLPRCCRAAFEFRNVSWFDDEIFTLLREHQAALCIAETDELQVPFVSTADWGYLRLRREDYNDSDLNAWAQRVREAPWQEAFVFFKHEKEARGPQFATRFSELSGVTRVPLPQAA